jgi:hypothetical protein
VNFDDHLWRDVWERNVDAVERHTIAVAVWRRRHPGGRFEAIVALELARRWRRHTVFLAVVYALWTVFWGMIALHDLRLDAAFESLVTPMCAATGLVAIAACMVVRRRIGGYLRANGALSG